MPDFKRNAHIPKKNPPTVSDGWNNEFPPYNVVMASTVDHSTNTKRVWFFDEDMVCRVREIPINEGTIPGFRHIVTTTPLKTVSGYKIGQINGKAIVHAILRDVILDLENGDAWDKFIDRYNKAVDAYYEKKDAVRERQAKVRCQRVIDKTSRPLSRTDELMQELRVPLEVYMFIQKIDQPTIEREYGNKSKNTFDFVRVYASVKNMDMEGKKHLLRKHRQTIMRLVLRRIETDANFRRYGIPLNFLRLTQCMLTRNHQIMFLFELKNTIKE